MGSSIHDRRKNSFVLFLPVRASLSMFIDVRKPVRDKRHGMMWQWDELLRHRGMRCFYMRRDKMNMENSWLSYITKHGSVFVDRY